MYAHINDWNDIHFAYQVARLGSLSAAADALQVHHSTVLRKINHLEASLKTRLFHRHARGYVTTEAGNILLGVAACIKEDLDRLAGDLQETDQQLKGTLVVTTVDSLVPVFMPLFHDFQAQNPHIQLQLVVDPRHLKLEHGEAHIGIRPGSQPNEPDYVAQNITNLSATLYASRSYLKRYGTFHGLDAVGEHRFISGTNNLRRVAFIDALEEQLPETAFIFRASDIISIFQAVSSGMGIAPLNCLLAQQDKQLIPLMPPPPQWQSNLWLVTHRDMHRTRRVQAFLEFFKGAIQSLS